MDLKKLNNKELLTHAYACKIENRVNSTQRFQKHYNKVIEELDRRGLLKK